MPTPNRPKEDRMTLQTAPPTYTPASGFGVQTPSGLDVDTQLNLVFVANQTQSGTVSIIDVSEPNTPSAAPGSPVAVGPYPHEVAVDSSIHAAFIANTGTSQASGVTVATGDHGSGDNTVSVLVQQNDQWVALLPPLTAGSEPHGLAVHPGKQLLFVANQKDNTVSIFDYSTLTKTPPSPPALVTTIALSANGANPNPHGIAVDTTLNQVYVACRQSGQVAVIQLEDGTWTNGTPVQLGASNQPTGVGVNSATGMAYVSVTNIASQDPAYSVAVIDGNNLAGQPATITSATFDGPDRFAVDDTNNVVYVSNNNGSTVSVIDAANGNAVSALNVPGDPAPTNSTPTELGFIALQQCLYVALQDANQVAILPV